MESIALEDGLCVGGGDDGDGDDGDGGDGDDGGRRGRGRRGRRGRGGDRVVAASVVVVAVVVVVQAQRDGRVTVGVGVEVDVEVGLVMMVAWFRVRRAPRGVSVMTVVVVWESARGANVAAEGRERRLVGTRRTRAGARCGVHGLEVQRATRASRPDPGRGGGVLAAGPRQRRRLVAGALQARGGE